MSRYTFLQALLVALVAALAVVPGTALGAKPTEQFHDHFTESFSGDICGIPVDIDVVGTDNFFLYENDDFKDTASVRTTFTNPVNGNAVVVSNANNVAGHAVIDEAAGTVTFFTSFKGVAGEDPDVERTGPSS